MTVAAIIVMLLAVAIDSESYGQQAHSVVRHVDQSSGGRQRFFSLRDVSFVMQRKVDNQEHMFKIEMIFDSERVNIYRHDKKWVPAWQEDKAAAYYLFAFPFKLQDAGVKFKVHKNIVINDPCPLGSCFGDQLDIVDQPLWIRLPGIHLLQESLVPVTKPLVNAIGHPYHILQESGGRNAKTLLVRKSDGVIEMMTVFTPGSPTSLSIVFSYDFISGVRIPTKRIYYSCDQTGQRCSHVIKEERLIDVQFWNDFDRARFFSSPNKS